MKRFLCVLLLCLMVFSFSCCEGKPSSGAAGEEKKEIDCGGIVFSVLQAYDKSKPFGYEAGSTYADLMREHIASRETQLGFSLQYLYKGDEQAISQELTKYAASGFSEASVAAWDSSDQMKLAFAECLYPLTELEGILDYTDPKFGGWGMLSLCMAHAVPYGVTPVLWPMMNATDCFVTVIYNGSYIKNLGLPTPWEYYEKGQWDFATFRKVISDYAFTEGDRKIPAVITNGWNFALGMWSACGVHMVGEGEDGSLIAGYESEKSARALDWMRSVLTENKDAISLTGSFDFYTRFLNGDSTMIIFDTNCIPTVAAVMEDFGIAPFPLGPDMTEADRIYLCSTGYSVQIPADAENPEAIGCILDSLCDPFEGYETEDKLVDLLYNTVFFDRGQAELFASMYKKAEPTYQGFNAHQVLISVAGEITGTGNKSVSEVLESAEHNLDSYIENYMGENYLYLKEIGFYH